MCHVAGAGGGAPHPQRWDGRNKAQITVVPPHAAARYQTIRVQGADTPPLPFPTRPSNDKIQAGRATTHRNGCVLRDGHDRFCLTAECPSCSSSFRFFSLAPRLFPHIARPDLDKIDSWVEPPLVEDVFVCCTCFLRMYIHRVSSLQVYTGLHHRAFTRSPLTGAPAAPGPGSTPGAGPPLAFRSSGPPRGPPRPPRRPRPAAPPRSSVEIFIFEGPHVGTRTVGTRTSLEGFRARPPE